MDHFDDVFNKVTKTPQTANNDETNQLLGEKRNQLFMHFSNTKSTILLIVYLISFLATVYNTVSGWFGQAASPGMFSVVLDLCVVAFTFMFPYALFQMVRASKSLDPKGFDQGASLAGKYFKIIKYLIFVVGAIVGFFLLFLIFVNFGTALLSILIGGLAFALAYFTNKAFLDFFTNLKQSFNHYTQRIPSTKDIVKFLIISIVLMIISYLVLVVTYEFLVQTVVASLPAEFEQVYDIDELITLLESLRIALYVSIAAVLLIQGYILYYFYDFDCQMKEFNSDYSKKVSAANDRAFNEGNTIDSDKSYWD